MTGRHCESEAAALVWCCWTDVSACSALSDSLQFKREHTHCSLPLFRCQLSSPHLLFSLLFCLLHPTSTIFSSANLCHFPLSPSIPTVCSLGCSDRCISFYTNLSALTVAVATHHCHGNLDELGGGKAGPNAKKYERERQQRVEKVTSLFSLNDKGGTRLLISHPLPVYQHKISGRHLLWVNSKGPVHLLV